MALFWCDDEKGGRSHYTPTPVSARPAELPHPRLAGLPYQLAEAVAVVAMIAIVGLGAWTAAELLWRYAQ